MKAASKSQKAAISQFVGITGADAGTAQQVLQAAGWHLEAACNEYLDGGSASSFARHSVPAIDQSSLSKLFDRYRDRNSDVILAEGVETFCNDLGVDPADIVMLVISYHFQAATACEYMRQEFHAGMTKLGCDSISKLKQKIPELRRQMRDPDTFQDVYNYAYMFSREKGQKCVQLDMAIGMWQLLFTQRPWPLLDAWCSFLQTHHKHAISKDTWTQLLDFIKTVKPDFSNFDDNAATSAWPYLVDDFIMYLREHPEVAKSSGSDQDVIMLDSAEL